MAAPPRPRRILIIDDEPGILEVLSHHLRSLNFDPLTTPKWTEALNQITHAPPDLILLDLCMPTVQGEVILEYLQQQGHLIPVIVISAHLDPERVEKLCRLGARKCISKPFQLSEIAGAVREELGEAGAPPPPRETAGAVEPLKVPDREAIRPAIHPGPVASGVPENGGKDPPPPNTAGSPGTPEPVALDAFSALDHEIAELAAARAQSSETSEAHTHHHHHHKRKKPKNVRLYVIVALACVFASLIVLVIEKLPAWMSSTFEQAVEKSMQSEIRRQTKGIEGLSDKQKEAVRKAMEKQQGR